MEAVTMSEAPHSSVHATNYEDVDPQRKETPSKGVVSGSVAGWRRIFAPTALVVQILQRSSLCLLCDTLWKCFFSMDRPWLHTERTSVCEVLSLTSMISSYCFGGRILFLTFLINGLNNGTSYILSLSFLPALFDF